MRVRESGRAFSLKFAQLKNMRDSRCFVQSSGAGIARDWAAYNDKSKNLGEKRKREGQCLRVAGISPRTYISRGLFADKDQPRLKNGQIALILAKDGDTRCSFIPFLQPRRGVFASVSFFDSGLAG